MTRARSSFALISASLALAACSAFGLGEHDLMPCDVSDPEACKSWNDELPVEQCARYYCQSGGGCRIETRMSDETCDGLDNDCDLIIDESAELKDEDVAPEQFQGVVERVSHAAHDTGTVQVAITHARTSDRNKYATTLLAVRDGKVQQHEVFAFDRCMGIASEQDCNIRDLAIASTSQFLLGAGFQRHPCGSGQLRIAAGSLAPLELALGEDAIRATTAITVDVEPTDKRCTVSAGCRGAEAPVVAVIPSLGGAPAEALIAWQAVAADDPALCESSSEHRIAAIGIPIEESGSSPRLVAPAMASSMLLSDLDATGGPALAAVTREGESNAAGFLVAFPSGDDIELRFIAAPTSAAGIKAGARETMEAPSAEALALTAGLSDARGLALAYRTMIDGEPVMQVVRLALGPGSEPHISRLGAAITLHADGKILHGPSLSYAPDGFAIPGEDRPAGGWIVTWVEEVTEDAASVTRLMLSRIAEAKTEEPGAAVRLATDAAMPFTYLKQQRDESSTLHAAYLIGDAIHFRAVTCNM
jgi:hypothetical protein